MGLIKKQKDIFDEIHKPLTKKYDPSKVPPVKPVSYDEIQEMIASAIAGIPKPEQKTVIQRVVEKVTETPKPDERLMEENNKLKGEISRLMDTVEGLKAEVKDIRAFTGDIIVPPTPLPHPTGKSGKVIGTDGKVYKWASDATLDTIYIGDQNTNGSWRIRVSGNNMVFERLESGTWTEKGAFLAS